MSATKTVTSPETGTDTAHAPRWLVTVHNDPVNLMGYVVLVFKKVLGMNQEDAVKHMMEVHTQGRSIVWSGDREPAEHRVHELQSWHLRATLDPAADDHA